LRICQMAEYIGNSSYLRRFRGFVMNKIFIIEDHPEVREPLARILKYEGYQTASAPNGAEALNMLGMIAPDLVLLDLVMPKMDGLRFLESLRGDERFAHLPVIVMTGQDGSAIARARELGVSAVISKVKFSVDGLLGQIRSQLSMLNPVGSGQAGAMRAIA